MERRYAELRYDAGTDSTAPRFYGTAIKYNVRTAIGNPKTWGFFEEIAPGAVDMSRNDIAMLVSHDMDRVVSRQSAGTLTLADSTGGLDVESTLDDDLSYVRDLKANLANKNVTGMSFGFRVKKGGADVTELDDGSMLRRVTALELFEVSTTPFPAYTSTDATMRDVPLLAERRSAWETKQASVNSQPEAAIQTEFRRRERHLRYLASRYGMAFERGTNA
jgi:HK97 family phage prohead protease